MANVGIDPSALDDQDDTKEEGSPVLRDLFWDKAVVFLSSAIVALTAVDILTELLRGGSDIVCFLPAELNVSDGQEEFANSYCGRSVPDTQYLPIFVLIHGVLIATWHYIWRSSFSRELSLFLSFAKDLSKYWEEGSGSYPIKNLLIVSKMESEFSTFNKRELFTYYQLKLIAQLLTALVSLFVTAFLFTEFDIEFTCPRDGVEMLSWPFPGHVVTCIFTSLRLFALVRVFDLLLLVFIVLVLVWGLLWSVWRHPNELGYKNIALFSFATGLDPAFFVPRPMFLNMADLCRGIFSRRILQELKLRFLIPRITTDLQFLLMLLYRSESSLAYSFKEGQVLAEQKALVNIEHQVLSSEDFSETDEQYHELEREQFNKIKIGWNIPKDFYNKFKQLDTKMKMRIPDNIRGAVVGLAQRCPDNCRAIDVSFGSQGFTTALARIFKLVGSINFDPKFVNEANNEHEDEETPVEVEVIRYPFNITGLRYYDDLFSRDADAYINFDSSTSELFEKDGDQNYYKIGMMVVGPISQFKHIATVNSLLENWGTFHDGALLVVVEPTMIEDSKGKSQFYSFTPPTRLFRRFDPNVRATAKELNWSTPPPASLPDETRLSLSPPPQTTPPAPPPSPSPSPIFDLQCGNTRCGFRLVTYKFVQSSSPGGELASVGSDKSGTGLLAKQLNTGEMGMAKAQ